MPTFTLPNVITASDLISYDMFPIMDSAAVSDVVLIKYLEASDKIINFLLRNIKWHGYRYTGVDKKLRIGYNLEVGADGLGLTEAESYRIWIEKFKEVERKFKKVMVLDSMSQSQYDGLLSMYYMTGDYTAVGTDIRKFKLFDYISARKWEYVATAMSNSGEAGRIMRQNEAKIIMLADYGIPKERILIKEQGLQDLSKRYPLRLLDDKAKAQAEYVYYAETGRFLPKTSESRKRILVQQLKT